MTNVIIDGVEYVPKEVEEKTEGWKPGDLEKYWYVNDYDAVSWNHWEEHTIDHNRLKVGNCFETEEEAEASKRHLIAMKPKFLPKKGELYCWVTLGGGIDELSWDNDFSDWLRYYSGLTFKTPEEAEAWLKEYGDIFGREE